MPPAALDRGIPSREPPLLYCAAYGGPAAALVLLEAGASLRLPTEQEDHNLLPTEQPVHRASLMLQPRTLRVLLEAAALAGDCTGLSEGAPALSITVLKAVHHLHQHLGNPRVGRLVPQSSLQTVETLLEHGADPNFGWDENGVRPRPQGASSSPYTFLSIHFIAARLLAAHQTPHFGVCFSPHR